MRRPNITMRFGALNDNIIVDGQVFNRSALSKREFGFLRNVVIDALVKVGSVSRRVAARGVTATVA